MNFYVSNSSNISFENNVFFNKFIIFKFNFSDKSLDPNFIYKGTINLKAFFSESSGNVKEINSNELLNPNSILIQFLKTEILNNKNLNMPAFKESPTYVGFFVCGISFVSDTFFKSKND